MPQPQPQLGEIVIYIDEYRLPCVALVAYIHPDRETVNLHACNQIGFSKPLVNIKPAYHNGVRWIIINHWVTTETFATLSPSETNDWLEVRAAVGQQLSYKSKLKKKAS